ncbi:Uracil DNA glycosylase superfamily protein [Bacteroidales bacterium Barb6XT]|nr:Uracil DNA glycosylase superfamily protein [Bacteroidales bacterium Barb6XT]
MTNTKIKKELENSLRPLYSELLEAIGCYLEKNPGEDLCAFCAQWGKEFPEEKNSGILFVGRATNGWHDEDLDVDTIFAKVFARDDQMEWINNYPRSAFFRVIRKTTQMFYLEEWQAHVAWSNLCKLAPQSGGNPNDSLYNSQLDACQKILEKEIEILSPKFAVMLTGDDWAKGFLPYLNGGEHPESIDTADWDGYEAKVYKIKNVTYIVSEHPQGKPEESHVKTIVELINKYQ